MIPKPDFGGRDTFAVTNWILDWCDLNGYVLTPLSLQKILYFVHGWWLACFDRPLINTPFQAWEYGPVVKSVYDCFKHYGDQPIHERALIRDDFSGERLIAITTFDERETKILQLCLNRYTPIRPGKLVEMTHRPGGAWDTVWNGKVKSINLKIKNDLIFQDIIELESDRFDPRTCRL